MNTTNRVRVDTERHINNLKYKNIVVMAQIDNKSKVFVEKLGSWVANKRSIERVEVDRHDKQYKARKKKKMERYDKSIRKVRYDNN